MIKIKSYVMTKPILYKQVGYHVKNSYRLILLTFIQ